MPTTHRPPLLDRPLKTSTSTPRPLTTTSPTPSSLRNKHSKRLASRNRHSICTPALPPLKLSTCIDPAQKALAKIQTHALAKTGDS
ncbi:hypothetical protein EYC80_009695 [Monilinia laxa]|uniref:Uncharacterized protein n=1 Tax=Monilinia laxa TaxID=61186 RepID=A0A5N6JYP8_MONLA|nr:hypothetical protein EYC80_009695 [Monilinia laxa]